MKKYIFIVLLLILVLITGCKNKKYIECTINVNNTVQNYTLSGTYKIYYKKGYVTSINKHDIYQSSDKEMKDYLSEYNNLYYTDLNNKYSGVTYDIQKKGDSIIIETDIDVKSMDINKLVKNKVLEQDYVKLNKITTSGMKKYYESKGAICSEK